VLDVEDWAEISRLRRSEGMSISQVSRVVGLARNTVKTALNNENPPGYRREPAGSRVDGLAVDPGTAAGVNNDAGGGDRGKGRLAIDDRSPILAVGRGLLTAARRRHLRGRRMSTSSRSSFSPRHSASERSVRNWPPC